MKRVLIRAKKALFVAVLLVWSLTFGVLVVGSQADTPTPIAIGDIQVGEITAQSPSVSFIVPVAIAQTLEIDVFAITPNLAPTFYVYNQSRAVIYAGVNVGGQATVQASSIPVDVGLYTVEVSSQTGIAGQFLLSIQSGTPLMPPQPLQPGQVYDGIVDRTEPRQAYSFASHRTESLLLTIYSMNPRPALEITLRDSATSDPIAFSNTRISGLRYQIVPGQDNYLVEVVTGNASSAQDYIICLEYDMGMSICPVGPEAPAPPELLPTPTPAPAGVPTATPIPLATLPVTGPCIVASSSGGQVNIRSGPSTNFSVLAQISGNTTVPVIGRLPGNEWYQVDVSGIIGWISATVIRIGGQCGAVPVIIPTPTPTAIGPTTAASATPTSTATSTATMVPTAEPTLNFSLPPVFGSTALVAGFVPDPFMTAVTGGGPVNVSYLSGACTGYTTSAPTFSVNYTAGAFPMLRIYFIGAGDTTMVVNRPDGTYVCVDDSFGTLNPALDFNSPVSGRYDIWIGTFTSGATIGGTLYVTENAGNHP